MSMPGVPQGRSEVGDTVASFPTYEAAQKAVSALIAGDVPARDIAIVGFGLRSIERVTGKLGYATAARTGAINGLLLGLFFSAIFLLGSPTVSVPVFIGVLFIGVALGMLMSIGAYAIVRRRRDFASVMQVLADHYEVTVLAGSVHRARELVGSMPGQAPRPGTTAQGQPPAAPPVREDAAPTPPRYGERIAPPAFGERAPEGGTAGHQWSQPEPSSSEAPQPEDAPTEPPRYGERIAEPVTPAEPADAAGPAHAAEPADSSESDDSNEPAADGRSDDDDPDDGDRHA
ncbi:general stress protein [Microbacterium terrisoli]|uniref:general stress protein n=1 Tax=Microbacterium terrisoli TaxID=3242192 RepID=UPI002804551B|nr:general stress protein [Microbacterium protaetiae]